MGGPRRIRDHAIIGDLQTVALVGLDGVIDFLCMPRFDSPTLFGELLDPQGGRFALGPATTGSTQQLYLPGTNVLVTRFLTSQGVAELTDFMPWTPDPGPPVLMRRIRAIDAEMVFAADCWPRPSCASEPPVVIDRDGDGLRLRGASLALRLRATVPLTVRAGAVAASFRLRPGESADFILEVIDEPSRSESPQPELPELVDQRLQETCAAWRAWLARSRYRGRWREMVHRSALTLKLLTSRRHGSMVAAATFGLPEARQADRDWDYRYTWIRDASFVSYAFVRLGFVDEAQGFIDWLGGRFEESRDGSLRPLYAVDGSLPAAEHVVPSLAGFDGQGGVLVGNKAMDQEQLDIYGGLVDAIYLSNKYGRATDLDAWVELRRTVDFVCQHWNEADEGIWEFRNGAKHYLHSRLMCWVAVDRSLRLARKRSFPAPEREWETARDAIAEDINAHFWDPELGSFVQSRGAKTVDASTLLMPMVRFLGGTDPRWLSTLRVLGERLSDDVLMYRYDNRTAPDGLPGHEGNFSPCSFWYVECLARAGQAELAQLTFEKMLGYANHVGLYAEELNRFGEQLGNFPQALTHLSLISAAFYLDRMLSGGPHEPWS